MRPTTTAEIKLVELTTAEGVLVLLPATWYDWATEHGVETLTVQLQPEDADRWLSIPEAGKAHMEDIDGLTEQQAAARVRHAANSGAIKSRGQGHARRIDPITLAAWRLAQREKSLDRMDAEVSPEPKPPPARAKTGVSVTRHGDRPR